MEKGNMTSREGSKKVVKEMRKIKEKNVRL